MKRIKFLTVSTLSAVLLVSISFSQRQNLRGHSMVLENGETSLQAQKISFSHLKVEEVERQAKGEVKEEDAIQAQERIFADSESWRAFWSSYGVSEVPKVNFKIHHVAAVFLGAKPNSGYGVEINRITYTPRKNLTVIHVVELLPDPQMAYLAVIVYPSDIVLFPAKPGKAQFARTRRIRTEQP
jgi:hypothetical protein